MEQVSLKDGDKIYLYKGKLLLENIKKDRIAIVKKLEQSTIEYGYDGLERHECKFEAILPDKTIKINSENLFGFNFIKIDELKAQISNLKNMLENI